jgi:hypothetical protein
MWRTSVHALISLELSGLYESSGGWDRTYTNTIDPQAVAALVSARASGVAFDVGHIAAPDRRMLARVVEAWPRLNGSLKLAILAIADAAGVKGGNQ